MRAAGDPELARALEVAARPAPGDDGRALTHGFHAWSARMHPHTAAALIRDVAAPGGVADPFMGGGTVLVEALCAGRPALGADINPVALEVAWARTRLWSLGRSGRLVGVAESVAERAREILASEPVPRGLRELEGGWYDPPALADLWSLDEAIAELQDTGLRRMMRACLSSLVVKASRQRSDSVAELDADHGWVPAGRVPEWLVRRADEHARSLVALREAVPAGTDEPRLALRDARAEVPAFAGTVGLVLTSPPYPGVYDYVQHQARRYALFRLDAREAADQEIGARRQSVRAGWMSVAWRFEQDLGAALTAWRPWLAPGGRVALVIGDGEHPERVIRVLPLIERAAAAAELVVMASVSQQRPVFGPARAQGDEHREEHIVLLEAAG